MAALAALYPRFEMTATTIEAYFAVLSDLPLSAIQAAALEIGTTSKWFPAASEIRETACNFVDGGPPMTGVEAWALLTSGMSRNRSTYPISQLEEMCGPGIRMALDVVGGQYDIRNRTIQEEPSMRARFVEAFEITTKKAWKKRHELPQVAELARLVAGDRPALLSDGLQPLPPPEDRRTHHYVQNEDGTMALVKL